MMAKHFSLHMSDRLLDDFIDVEPGDLWIGVFGELADPAYDVTSPFGVPYYALHAGDRLFRLRHFASKPAQACLTIGSDGAKRLTDLMRNRGAHRPEGCHAGNMSNLRLRLLQGLMFELQRLI